MIGRLRPVLLMSVVRIALVAALIAVASSSTRVFGDEPSASVVASIVDHTMRNGDGLAAFSFDAAAYREELRDLPIGVFDSGIGGLTVLEAILSLDRFHNDTLRPGPDGRRDFENERFIYFGDQANMPYGNYGAAGRQDFLRELILKDVTFLLGRRYKARPDAPSPSYDKPPVKAIVIACNTATAYGLADIRQAMQAWNIPVIVIGVVEAGARGVNELTSADETSGNVAVLATIGTCGTMAYPKAIGGALGLAGKRVPEIIQQGSLGLAGAIEGDPAFVVSPGKEFAARLYQGPRTDHPIAPLSPTDLQRYGFESAGLLGDVQKPETVQLNSVVNYVNYDVTSLMENYRRAGHDRPIDTVVLGCTHFPLAERELLSAFARLREYNESGATPYRALIAEQIRIVNPAELTATELFRRLAGAKIRRQTAPAAVRGRDLFFISVPNPGAPGVRLSFDGSLDRDYKYGRSPGRLMIEDTHCVPMTVAQLPPSSLQLIQTRLPTVWSRLQAE